MIRQVARFMSTPISRPAPMTRHLAANLLKIEFPQQLSSQPSTADRLSIRGRPDGFPLMHQSWGKLLFMHWPIDAEILHPLIPSQLAIDTFDGSAWIGEIPFWFFSLDAANSLAVWGAREFYHLSYFNAAMSLTQQGNTIEYSSKRKDALTYGQFFNSEKTGFPEELTPDRFRSLPPAELNTSWTIGEPLPQSTSDSIEFFLTERYCLYSYYRSQLFRSRIFHEPWRLQSAHLNARQSTMIESLGIAVPQENPLLHYAEAIAVDIWPLKRV